MRESESTDSIQQIYQKVFQDLKKWFKIYDIKENDNSYQENLMDLFAKTASKHYAIKEMPCNMSEWNRLLSHWLRQNIFENCIKDRDIYIILSVDGFMGFQPKDLKKYLTNIINKLRNAYYLHNEAVRIMYKWIDNSKISSLTGTDSGSVIFLALLNVYENNLTIYDNEIKMNLYQIKTWVEGYLHQHSNYYKIIKEIDNDMLKELGSVYKNQFLNDDQWKTIAKEQVTKMKNYLNDEK